MCGIFGMSEGFSVNISGDLDALRMNLKHRGPDGSGLLFLEGLGLGHCLLAIRDPGNSPQPMFSKSGRHVISYNGEIYNLEFLKSKLPGFNWRTSGDTELLVELLEHFGPSILGEIEGMFAIAIWNIETRCLILARDRMGEKPLYFNLTKSGQIAFASEVYALANLGSSKPKLNIGALRHYLKYMYIPVTASIYEGIDPVLPGQYLIWDKDSFSAHEYHSQDVNEYSKSEIASGRDLKNKIANAVRGTLVSDVGIGVMLSGGLDSSIIALEASRSIKKIDTYCVAFQNSSEDAVHAKIMASRINSRHTELYFPDNELADVTFQVLSKAHQPFGDNSLIPTFLLANEANKNVKVLLSGDGADELFSGYRYYDKYAKRNFNFSYQTTKSLNTLRRLLAQQIPTKKLYEINEEKTRLDIAAGKLNWWEAWNQDLSLLTDLEVDVLIGSGPLICKSTIQSPNPYDGMSSILLADQASYLPGDILTKSDIGGMLASVELRAPFLSKEVVAHARNLTAKTLGTNKKILRQIYKLEIPPEILSRKKQGFGAPVGRWLATPSFTELSSSILLNHNSQIYFYLQFNSVREIIKKSPIVHWNILSLAIWLEENQK
jgi:asparagine synthase (glutamine-hydrolysing)